LSQGGIVHWFGAGIDPSILYPEAALGSRPNSNHAAQERRVWPGASIVLSSDVTAGLLGVPALGPNYLYSNTNYLPSVRARAVDREGFRRADRPSRAGPDR